MTSEQFQNRVIPLSTRIFPMAARMLGRDEDAEDAVQEIMIKLWKTRKKLMNHPNLEGFVFLTARNHCLDLLRQNIKEQAYTGYQERIPDKSGDHLEQKEIYTIIRSIIHELPDNQKTVMLLYEFDGLTFLEIAGVTGLKIEHIRVLLSRARKFVGQKLTKIYSYEQGKAS